jgi:DNA-binding NarL/FixJ family response regulator
MLKLFGGLRVVLADDHKIVLERVQGLLDSDFELVGAVDNGRALLAMARELRPDVAVVDIEMPVLDGLEAVREIRKLGGQMKVIFLTVHEHPDMISLCFQAGALGYGIKSSLASDLIPAIRLAVTNQTFVSPSLPRFGA